MSCNGDSFVSFIIRNKAPPNHVLAGQTDPKPAHVEVDDTIENYKEIYLLKPEISWSFLTLSPNRKQVCPWKTLKSVVAVPDSRSW